MLPSFFHYIDLDSIAKPNWADYYWPLRGAEVENGAQLLELLPYIQEHKKISFDTETTGLYPFKDDEMFVLVIGINNIAYYIDLRDKDIHFKHLLYSFLIKLLTNPDITMYGFNAKFDLHFIFKYISRFSFLPPDLKANVIDVKGICRLENNSYISYSLDECAKREGLSKDSSLEEYINKGEHYSFINLPGKLARQKALHFDRVPKEIMFRYACTDAIITYKLAERKLRQLSECSNYRYNIILENENKLLKNVLLIERNGLKINKDYVINALGYESHRELNAKADFKALVGCDYMSSPKLFAKIFENEKDKWKYTEKGNPSFDSDVISTFNSPVAKAILTLRDSKSRQDFYNSFLYYADNNYIIHPNLDPHGTTTGRFSSSQPNFQNLTNEEEDTKYGFLIRRAIVPRKPGNVLISIDYSQQEYRLMLDYAGEIDLINSIMNGADVHQATADMMGVSRREAKILNFMLLYGGGAQKLADSLGVDLYSAMDLKNLYFSRLPMVKRFINTVIQTAKNRGYIFNWLGRKLQFPDTEFAYKAPNALIQSGGADIMKVAINKVCDYISEKKIEKHLFPVLTVHDELILEGDKNIAYEHVQEIKNIMERVYPYKNIPMACSVAWSEKSLAEPDMVEVIAS